MRAPSKGPDSYHYARYEYAKEPAASAAPVLDDPLGWLDDEAELAKLPRRHTR